MMTRVFHEENTMSTSRPDRDDDERDPFVDALVADLMQALERLDGDAIECLETEPTFLARVRDRLHDLARELGHNDYRHLPVEQRLKIVMQAVAGVYFAAPTPTR